MAMFSKSYGPTFTNVPVVVREDAPTVLRDFVIQTLYSYGYAPSFLRRIICQVLKISPNPSNWGEYPNIENEVYSLIHECPWYKVYDIIEQFSLVLIDKHKEQFLSEINAHFNEHGIGWKLISGQIEVRGDATFETAITKVAQILEDAKYATAKSEIEEAIADLSRRPKPDITGAIQHSLASLECVCREVTGDKKATLGELIKKSSGIVPPPLDQVISRIWGYSSEQGRHLQEGREPDYLEAELLVELTSALISYLGKKVVQKSQENG